MVVAAATFWPGFIGKICWLDSFLKEPLQFCLAVFYIINYFFSSIFCFSFLSPHFTSFFARSLCTQYFFPFRLFIFLVYSHFFSTKTTLFSQNSLKNTQKSLAYTQQHIVCTIFTANYVNFLRNSWIYQHNSNKITIVPSLLGSVEMVGRERNRIVMSEEWITEYQLVGICKRE